MESKEFLNYLKTNVKSIYNNFQEVFNFNYEEYVNLIKRLLKDTINDIFYQRLLTTTTVDLSKENLLKIKELIMKLNIKEDQIKEIIITIPEIVFFANLSENIFPIYKNNIFKGLAFVNGNAYRAYSYSLSSFKLNNLNNIADENVNYFNYVIDSLLRSLERQDIKEKLNLKPNAPLNEKFLSLAKEYSKKNYYFKKL